MLNVKISTKSGEFHAVGPSSCIIHYIVNYIKPVLVAFFLLLILSIEVNAAQKRLTWQDNSDNELGFVVQVCPGSCIATSAGWKELIKVGVDVNTLIMDVPDNAINSYRVGGFNDAGVNFSSIVIDRFTSPIAPTLTSLLNQACKTVTLTQTSPGIWKSVCS